MNRGDSHGWNGRAVAWCDRQQRLISNRSRSAAVAMEGRFFMPLWHGASNRERFISIRREERQIMTLITTFISVFPLLHPKHIYVPLPVPPLNPASFSHSAFSKTLIRN